MAAEHFQAVFVDTASTPASVLHVKIPGFDNGVGLFQVLWSPLGNALPAAGDEALVVEADDGTWWAVTWESGAQTTVTTAPEAITAVAGFANSWVNFDADRPAGYYRDRGRVYLTGIIKSGTLTATAFTLPTGYRPLVGGTAQLTFAVDSNVAHGSVFVFADGRVVPQAGSNAYVSLDGISFRHA